MNRNGHEDVNRQIIDEAAEWFVELSTEAVDAATRLAFDTWLRKSPENVRAYLEMIPLWEDAPLIDSVRECNAEQLIALARRGDQNVVLLPTATQDQPIAHTLEPSKPNARKSGFHHLALAASVLVTIAGITGWLFTQRGVYTTDIGEQRIISLPDGSNIELNARSSLRVRYDNDERRVELIAGQALFAVAKEKHRPFVVESGDTRVRAVGTQFDVYRKRSGTTVTVVEGRVAIAKAGSADAMAQAETSTPLAVGAGEILVSAGEQLTVSLQAHALQASSQQGDAIPARADVPSATAWRQRRLVFSSTPLPEVAEEFNRYNTRQLVVIGPALESFNVSAVFSATDIPSLLHFLRAQPNIAIEESEREIRIVSQLR